MTLLGDKTLIPDGENERSEFEILGEIFAGLICVCCCLFFVIIIRWIDVCVAADDVDGDGDMDESRVWFPWNNIPSNCSWAISGGGGGGKGSSDCCWYFGGNCSGHLLWLFFSIVAIEPFVLMADRCWLDVSGVPRMKELFNDLFALKWCKSLWKWDTGLTGVGGSRSVAAREIGGEAWTSKLFAIIVEELADWEKEDDEVGGGKGDIALLVLLLSNEHRFWTKIIILFENFCSSFEG